MVSPEQLLAWARIAVCAVAGGSCVARQPPHLDQGDAAGQVLWVADHKVSEVTARVLGRDGVDHLRPWIFERDLCCAADRPQSQAAAPAPACAGTPCNRTLLDAFSTTISSPAATPGLVTKPAASKSKRQKDEPRLMLFVYVCMTRNEPLSPGLAAWVCSGLMKSARIAKLIWVKPGTIRWQAR